MAIQFILNCAGNVAGSCHGGSASGTYQYVKDTGFWPYDTCLQYEACSSESSEGHCGAPGADFSCSAMNTCRTCSTFSGSGGFCAGISTFPNASIAEYGNVKGAPDMQAEIYARGPIACAVDATPLHKYTGGIFDDASASKGTNHIVSVVGWGTDKVKGKYWIVRNSWGEVRHAFH
jgi:cathepsin X